MTMTLLKGRIERPEKVVRFKEGLSVQWIFNTVLPPSALASAHSLRRKENLRMQNVRRSTYHLSTLSCSAATIYDSKQRREPRVSSRTRGPETIILIRGC